MSIPTFGGTGGSGQRITCPPGYLMTDTIVYSGSIVDKIKSARCQSIDSLFDTTLPQTKKDVGGQIGGGGGSPKYFNCPPGSALYSLQGRYGRIMDKVFMNCRKVGDDAVVSQFSAGGSGGNRSGGTACPPGHFISELQGSGGDAVDSLGATCINITPIRSTFSNKSRQEQCCLGTLTGFNNCGQTFSPGSEKCKNIMREYCLRDQNLLQDKCKKWAQEQGRSAEDGIWSNWCKNNQEHERCGCFYPIYDKSLPSSIPKVPQCFAINCAAVPNAYKTRDQQSVDCGTICNQQINLDDLKSDDLNILLKDINFKNQCGQGSIDDINKELEKRKEEEEEEKEEEEEENPSSPKSESNFLLYAGIGGGVLVLIIIMVVLLL